MSEHEPPETEVTHIKIIINGRPKEVAAKQLTFDELVQLAFAGQPQDPGTFYTITFRRGPDNKHEGSLVVGESVKVKDGMVFNVTLTNKS